MDQVKGTPAGTAARVPAVRPFPGALTRMFLWFLGTALVTVWYVFTDPRFDYRLLLVGAVLPDVIDVPWRPGTLGAQPHGGRRRRSPW